MKKKILNEIKKVFGQMPIIALVTSIIFVPLGGVVIWHSQFAKGQGASPIVIIIMGLFFLLLGISSFVGFWLNKK